MNEELYTVWEQEITISKMTSAPFQQAQQLNCLPLCFQLIVHEEHWSPAHWMGHQKQRVLPRQMPLHCDGTSTSADDDTMKSSSRNNGSLSGDSGLLPWKVPEGCLLSCILKELFSQNKTAQSVIKAPRWRSRPFMCSLLRALPFPSC